MGEITNIGFGALALVGIVLITTGVWRRRRSGWLSGTALLATLAGIWLFGLPGLAVGMLAFAFLWFGRKGGNSNGDSSGTAGKPASSG